MYLAINFRFEQFWLDLFFVSLFAIPNNLFIFLYTYSIKKKKKKESDNKLSLIT